MLLRIVISQISTLFFSFKVTLICAFNRIIASCKRDNLKFIILHKTSKKGAIADIINKLEKGFAQQSGIIYCFSRDDCELLASQLVDVGIPADFYHSKLSEVGKTQAYFKWMEGVTLVGFF